MKIKVDEFEKKGKTIEVLVKIVGIDRYIILLRTNGHEVYAEIDKPQGVDGYRVSKDGIKKLFNVNVKGDVLLSNDNTPKVKEKAEALLKEHREKLLEEARKKLTDETEIKLFISTSHNFITVEDVEYADELEELKEGEDLIRETMEISDIESVLGRKHDEFDIDDYSSTHTFYMTYAEFKKIIKAAEQKKMEIKQRKQELEAQRQKEIEEKFKQARETGEKVELERWTAECDDPTEDCDIDIVIKYAMPDGATKTERYHTY